MIQKSTRARLCANVATALPTKMYALAGGDQVICSHGMCANASATTAVPAASAPISSARCP